MDILFHGAVGLVITKAVTGDYMLSGALVAMLPDFTRRISLMLESVEAFKKADKTSLRSFIKDWQQTVKQSKSKNFLWISNIIDRFPYYHTTHNLFFWLAITVLYWLLFPSVYIPLSLCHLSHLVVDWHSHDGGFSSKPLYPLSGFTITSRACSKDKLVYFGSWILLSVVFVMVNNQTYP